MPDLILGAFMFFGAHQSIAGGLHKSLERGQKATCDVIQIFTKSNNQWKAKELTDEQVELFLSAIEETSIQVPCAHSSYLINLASPDAHLRTKSITALCVEMQRCHRLRIPQLVIHPGSHVGAGEETGIQTIFDSINKVFDQLGPQSVSLCLETTAGQGSNLGHTFEQIAAIIDGIDNQVQMSVCLDSCHVFAAGYPISNPFDYGATIKHIDTVIGLDRLKIIHLNDSKHPLGSRKDRHEHIGKGHIGTPGFQNLVNDPRLNHIPMMLETPKGDDLKDDRKNLEVLRSLIGETDFP